MTSAQKSIDARPEAQRMRLRYGFNEVDAWWHIGLGEHRERIQGHLRRMHTSVIRIFVFDKPVPDPVSQWSLFAAYVQGVLDAGAVPMITFAKFHPPHDDPRNGLGEHDVKRCRFGVEIDHSIDVGGVERRDPGFDVCTVRHESTGDCDDS